MKRGELVFWKPNIYPSGLSQLPRLVPRMKNVLPSGVTRWSPLMRMKGLPASLACMEKPKSVMSMMRVDNKALCFMTILYLNTVEEGIGKKEPEPFQSAMKGTGSRCQDQPPEAIIFPLIYLN